MLKNWECNIQQLIELMKIDKYKTHESSPQKTLLGNVLGTIARDYLI
jgi:hypothetical protein